MSWPKKIFDAAITRTETLVRFYRLLHSRRSRILSDDDLADTNAILGWPDTSYVMLIGGRTKKSAILLRDPGPHIEEYFLHDATSDLLRAAHMMCVAAMDRYFHDKIVEKSWSLLNATDSPKHLADFPVPLSVLRDALKRLRNDEDARPGSQVKKTLQTLLTKHTFQSSSNIEKAIGMLGGVTDLWNEIGGRMNPTMNAEPLKARLNGIVKRRNEIVHESDFILMTRPREPKIREIERKQVSEDIDLIKQFVAACDAVVR